MKLCFLTRIEIRQDKTDKILDKVKIVAEISNFAQH